MHIGHLHVGPLKVSLKWVWYDLWIGVYIDVENSAVYICPLPTVVIKIQKIPVAPPRYRVESKPAVYGKSEIRPEFSVDDDLARPE